MMAGLYSNRPTIGSSSNKCTASYPKIGDFRVHEPGIKGAQPERYCKGDVGLPEAKVIHLGSSPNHPRGVHWHDDPKLKDFFEHGVPVGEVGSDILHLITELDRRFCQLWDKVTYEREHELVTYTHELKDLNNNE